MAYKPKTAQELIGGTSDDFVTQTFQALKVYNQWMQGVEDRAYKKQLRKVTADSYISESMNAAVDLYEKNPYDKDTADKARQMMESIGTAWTAEKDSLLYNQFVGNYEYIKKETEELALYDEIMNDVGSYHNGEYKDHMFLGLGNNPDWTRSSQAPSRTEMKLDEAINHYKSKRRELHDMNRIDNTTATSIDERIKELESFRMQVGYDGELQAEELTHLSVGMTLGQRMSDWNSKMTGYQGQLNAIEGNMDELKLKYNIHFAQTEGEYPEFEQAVKDKWHKADSDEWERLSEERKVMMKLRDDVREKVTKYGWDYSMLGEEPVPASSADPFREGGLNITTADLGEISDKAFGMADVNADTVASQNNNPGNLKFAGQPGAVEGEGGFAVFDKVEQGWTGLEKQIKKDQERGDTIDTFIRGDAKRGGYSATDQDSYVEFMIDELAKEGYEVNKDFKIKDIDTRVLARIVAQKEGFLKKGGFFGSGSTKPPEPVVIKQTPITSYQPGGTGRKVKVPVTQPPATVVGGPVIADPPPVVDASSVIGLPKGDKGRKAWVTQQVSNIPTPLAGDEDFREKYPSESRDVIGMMDRSSKKSEDIIQVGIDYGKQDENFVRLATEIAKRGIAAADGTAPPISKQEEVSRGILEKKFGKDSKIMKGFESKVGKLKLAKDQILSKEREKRKKEQVDDPWAAADNPKLEPFMFIEDEFERAGGGSLSVGVPWYEEDGIFYDSNDNILKGMKHRKAKRIFEYVTQRRSTP